MLSHLDRHLAISRRKSRGEGGRSEWSKSYWLLANMPETISIILNTAVTIDGTSGLGCTC